MTKWVVRTYVGEAHIVPCKRICDRICRSDARVSQFTGSDGGGAGKDKFSALDR